MSGHEGSRRDFMGALLSTVVLGGGCQVAGPLAGPGAGGGPPDKAAARAKARGKAKAGGKAKGHDDGSSQALRSDQLREAQEPPVRFPRRDGLGGIQRVKAPGSPDMVEVAGDSPDKMADLGLEAIGGIGTFVKRGDRVVISPNFAWARPAYTGVTTCPELVRTVIMRCKDAGAREITCLDFASDPTPRAFRVCGAYQAVTGTGASLLSPWSAEQYVVVEDFNAQKLHDSKLGWQAVPAALLRCDVFINMPVFKHHREVRVTGALKKLMGCVWRRATYHKVGLDRCIAELAAVLRPTLTITDGMRVLATNGPNGPGKVEKVDRLLFSTDPLLADAYACRWLSVKPTEVRHLALAASLGVGNIDPSKATIEKVGLRGKGRRPGG